MSYVAEELFISTSDLSITGLRTQLRAATESSLAAIRSLFSGLSKAVFSPRTDIKAEDVVLSELLNKRGPAAWLAACDTDADSSAQLKRLAANCLTTGTVLVLPSQSSFDLVLVPREACTQDGVAFAAFATRVEGICFISQTIAAKQVAVVLDLDSTLLESEHLYVQPSDWRGLHWQTVSLTQEPSGQAVSGKTSQLPDEPHHAEAVHAASWMWRGLSHNYRVRQRLGWSQLRDLLIQETRSGGKLCTYVLSLGRPLYIQTAWQILDPAGKIIARHEFARKVNSARPDGVSHIPEKTPCIGVGLRSVFDQDFNMRLGPVWIADDMPEVYVDNYRDAIFAVPAYKPVANKPTTYDADGSVLRGMGPAIMRYWQHCYGADGCGGAVAALTAAAREALHQLSWVPLVLEPAAAAAGQPGEGTAEGPAEAAAAQGAPEGEAVPLAGCQGLNKLFRDQEALSTAISVHAFLEQERALLPAPVDEAVPMVEDAVPCQPAAGHENDENSSLQTTASLPGCMAPASAERALRPSSRQDILGGGADPHPPPQQHKAGSGQQAAAVTPALAEAAPATGAASQQPADGEVAMAGISISIVPPAEGNEGNDSCLVLLLQGQAQQALPGTAAAMPAVPAAAAAGESALEEGEVRPVVLLAETAWLNSSEAGEVEAMLDAQQEGDEGGAAGRKRDFAAIVGQDSLLAKPGSPSTVMVDA